MAMGNLLLSVVGSGGGGRGYVCRKLPRKEDETAGTMGKGGGGTDDEMQGGGGATQNQGTGRGRMAMGNLVLSVIGSGGGGSKEYSSINPDSLLLHHHYLFDTNFEYLGSGPTLQCLLWLADMDTAFAASCLASAGTLKPEAVAYFSEEHPGCWTGNNGDVDEGG
jgi:hypothetical protein